MTRLAPEAADPPIPAIAEDGTLYPVGKLAAHRLGVHHLAVSVFVFDGEGRLLLQQRAAGKYHSPGQWANTCCTHPHWGEALAVCASRRLREELGIDLPLARHDTLDYAAEVGNGLVERERVTLYSGRAPAALALAPDPAEVAATRWLAPHALAREIAARPDDFTPWLRIYLDRYPDLGLGPLRLAS